MCLSVYVLITQKRLKQKNISSPRSQDGFRLKKSESGSRFAGKNRFVSVYGLITQEWPNRLGCNVYRWIRLGLGMVLG